MCCGSAARRRFGAADHALAQVRPRQFIFLLGGGGVVRLTAKPRYLLLLHRGNEKSNTVTALILLFIKSTVCCIAHFISLHILLLIFILFLPILYIFSCVMFLFFFLHCPLSGPVLIYISLLIISYIIEYVTNKRTLNMVEVWWNSHFSALAYNWWEIIRCKTARTWLMCVSRESE